VLAYREGSMPCWPTRSIDAVLAYKVDRLSRSLLDSDSSECIRPTRIFVGGGESLKAGCSCRGEAPKPRPDDQVHLTDRLGWPGAAKRGHAGQVNCLPSCGTNYLRRPFSASG
jgi:hypothetical protein